MKVCHVVLEKCLEHAFQPLVKVRGERRKHNDGQQLFQNAAALVTVTRILRTPSLWLGSADQARSSGDSAAGTERTGTLEKFGEMSWAYVKLWNQNITNITKDITCASPNCWNCASQDIGFPGMQEQGKHPNCCDAWCLILDNINTKESLFKTKFCCSFTFI